MDCRQYRQGIDRHITVSQRCQTGKFTPPNTPTARVSWEIRKAKTKQKIKHRNNSIKKICIHTDGCWVDPSHPSIKLYQIIKLTDGVEELPSASLGRASVCFWDKASWSLERKGMGFCFLPEDALNWSTPRVCLFLFFFPFLSLWIFWTTLGIPIFPSVLGTELKLSWQF